jgi:hypothetical protein
MISYRDLVKNKEYSVKSPDGIFKRMIFLDYDASYNFGLKTRMSHEFAMDTYGTFIEYHNKKRAHWFRGSTSLFYDPEEIKKNAQKAIEKMEHRTVNMILKKIVNEEFQWS